MRKVLICFLCTMSVMLMSCQESMEEKAAREAADYTRKYCPTPVINYTSTDSVTFDRETKTYTYHCSLHDAMDNIELISANRKEITQALEGTIKESTNMKPYLQAGFRFQYICRSAKNPKVILLQTKF